MLIIQSNFTIILYKDDLGIPYFYKNVINSNFVVAV